MHLRKITMTRHGIAYSKFRHQDTQTYVHKVLSSYLMIAYSRMKHAFIC